MNSTSRFRMISSKSNNNMILDHSKLCLSLKLPESSFEEVNLNGGDSNKTPVNESPERSIENHHTISSSTNDWTSIQGPFRKPPRLLHHHHHQNNGYHLQRSESSSTDPSVYHPNFNSFDSTFDEELQPERESSSSSTTTFNQFHQNFRENDFHEKSSDGGGGDQTPTNPNSIGINRSRSPLLNRTPSSTSNAQLDELLSEIYSRFGNGFRPFVDSSQRASASGSQDSDCLTEYSTTSEPVGRICCRGQTFCNQRGRSNLQTPHHGNNRRESQTTRQNKLKEKNSNELKREARHLESQIAYCMSQLTRQVKRRDRLRHRRERQYNLVTAILQASSPKRSQDTKIRFSLEPYPGDPSFNQWKDAMKMVARLPEGVPTEFRKKLWLTLAERYLNSKSVDWKKAERTCFNEWSNPDDDELGLQIVRDLHRTGCSLFCGEDALANQLMLKRVLLAYARWNKNIGYCQGFNMLAAIILEVMEKAESDALKVMIFMIEGILPENYFSSNLKGLSVDMAVFRDLMKLRLPRLSKHLDDLQNDANDGCSPANYEPPLTNVFTMQWFLTLFSTCLPKDTVLRVWDLILLEGNEVLLRTALAIWIDLQERVILVKSADEFYCAMGQLSQEMLQYSIADSNRLIKTLVDIAPFPFSEVEELREKYTFNITPWSLGIGVAKKGLRILYSDDEDEDEDDQFAVAATFGSSLNLFKTPKTSPVKPSSSTTTPMGSNKTQQQNPQKMMQGPSQQNVDKERLTVDISALRQQYRKLRQRQQQAHIILTSALQNGEPGKKVTTGVSNASTAMNHLLLGKKPLVATKPRRGPHPGAIPSPKNKRAGPRADSGNQRNSTATQYACPQPEIVPPSEVKKSKKKHRRKISTDDLNLGKNNDNDTSSSTTEIGCEDSEGSDIDELPQDINTNGDIASDKKQKTEKLPPKICIEELSTNNGGSKTFLEIENPSTIAATALKTSKSSNELMCCDSNKSDQVLEQTKSESDLLLSKQQQHQKQPQDAKFLKELIEEFDKHTVSESSKQTEKRSSSSTTEIPSSSLLQNDLSGLHEPINDEDLDHNDDDDKALEIIKDNSEILEKLLSKKTTPCHPELLAAGHHNRYNNTNPATGKSFSTSNKTNGNNIQYSSTTGFGTGTGNITQPPSTSSAVVVTANTVCVNNKPVNTTNNIPKRRISQTSSNGSSSNTGSPGSGSNITLQSNPATKPITFNPFPSRTNRKPKEVGKKLGLYK